MTCSTWASAAWEEATMGSEGRLAAEEEAKGKEAEADREPTHFHSEEAEEKVSGLIFEQYCI